MTLLLKFSHKKLIPLLCLEGLTILIIWKIWGFCSMGFSQDFFSYLLIFLIMMVLDSVMGICLLIFSSRVSIKMPLLLC